MGPTNIRRPLRSRECRCLGGYQAGHHNRRAVLAGWGGNRTSNRYGTGGTGGILMDASLEEILGVHFQNPESLHMALTHRSYIYETAGEGLSSNERLEFLGDSILAFI